MSDPRHHLLELDGAEIHLAEWGPPEGDVIVAWHGLARSGADFASMAHALADRFRILAPDTLGRGASAWARDPGEYRFERYERLATALVDRFGLSRLRWVGTSMGGALGIRLAAGALAGRITHLVVNDIGPELPSAAIERILTYVGTPPAFDTLAELETYLRRVYAPYGFMSEAEWRAMSLTSWRRRDDGRLTLHYDPAIVRQFTEAPDDYVQWDAWRAIACPTLLLRGEDSDLLLPATAAAMVEANPRATLRVVPGCGHAPALNVPTQTGPLRAFLTAG
ncbi:alpha/beta fold hydrolase [Arenibaculum pallidiluteum]|uniref:alpha/beta fold hydrolase n=1 Tax=Arenibaculum pallidiluteum TaxID=2812559 RepID=UPI001F48D92D|nr:alpha/beta hydrolase [Arenibaculum pallidiluteum]